MTTDREILSRARDNVIDLFPRTKATFNWKNTLDEELSLFKQGVYTDYDFDGIIKPEIIRQAKKIIEEELPLLITPPEIGINDDGTLLLEWAKREDNSHMTMFSLMLNGTEIIFSLMHSGDIKEYGAKLHTKNSIKEIENLLNQYFEKDINPKRTAAR